MCVEPPELARSPFPELNREENSSTRLTAPAESIFCENRTLQTPLAAEPGTLQDGRFVGRSSPLAGNSCSIAPERRRAGKT